MAFPELDQFLEILHRKGHRVTSERLRLFREVYSQHGHIDAEALLKSIQRQGLKISRATLYRNLDLMAELGFVRKYRLGSNRLLYEHVHAGQRHDHLVCSECGRVPTLSCLRAKPVSVTSHSVCPAPGDGTEGER